GDFCEYGCGVAPVTAWLRSRFPRWRFTLVDLPTPTLAFARWRFRRFPNVELEEPGLGADLPLTRAYDVITCLDVLEHVINPLEVVRHLVDHLKPGGELRLNFIDAPGGENLVESAAQRADTIAYLNRALEAVVPLPSGSRAAPPDRRLRPRRLQRDRAPGRCRGVGRRRVARGRGARGGAHAECPRPPGRGRGAPPSGSNLRHRLLLFDARARDVG